VKIAPDMKPPDTGTWKLRPLSVSVKKQRKEGDRNLRAEADKPAAAQNLPCMQRQRHQGRADFKERKKK